MEKERLNYSKQENNSLGLKNYKKDIFENFKIFDENIIWENTDGLISIYIKYNDTKKIIGYASIYGNELLRIVTINANGNELLWVNTINAIGNELLWVNTINAIGNNKNIKGIGTYIIFKILNTIKSDKLIISCILNEALGFYQKVAERFLEKGYIKKYEFKNKELILYK